MLNIEQLLRVLTVRSMVRDLLKDFPGNAELLVIRAELVDLVKAART